MYLLRMCSHVCVCVCVYARCKIILKLNKYGAKTKSKLEINSHPRLTSFVSRPNILSKERRFVCAEGVFGLLTSHDGELTLDYRVEIR